MAATTAEAVAAAAASTLAAVAARGGASWAIPGGSAISYGLGTSGQNGSVTITPLPKSTPPVGFSVNTAASSTTVAWGRPVALTATLPADANGDVGFYDDINRGCDGNTGPGSACQGLGTATLYDGTATLPNPDMRARDRHPCAARLLGWRHPLQPGRLQPCDRHGDQSHPRPHPGGTGTVFTTRQALPPWSSRYQQTPPGPSPSTPTPNRCSGSAPIQNGYATLTSLSTTLAVGTHQLSASYSGDAHYNSGQSNSVVVTVSSTTNAQR